MSNNLNKSATSLVRGSLAGRIAGAAVGAALFLGAPILGTLIVEPAVAVAAPFDISDFDFCQPDGTPDDCDADGLANDDENRIGTNVAIKDTDSDGRSDHYEVLAGTDPLDPTSKSSLNLGKPLFPFDFRF